MCHGFDSSPPSYKNGRVRIFLLAACINFFPRGAEAASATAFESAWKEFLREKKVLENFSPSCIQIQKARKTLTAGALEAETQTADFLKNIESTRKKYASCKGKPSCGESGFLELKSAWRATWRDVSDGMDIDRQVPAIEKICTDPEKTNFLKIRRDTALSLEKAFGEMDTYVDALLLGK